MFNLFKRDEGGPRVVDKVWGSKEAKWNTCKKMLSLNSSCLFAAWFTQTKEELEIALGEPVRLAGDLSAGDVAGKMVVFVEHHPFWKKEEDLYARLSLGMKEDEPVGNKWVAKSIRNAQQKIQEKVEVEKPANSQEEWLSLNLPRK